MAEERTPRNLDAIGALDSRAVDSPGMESGVHAGKAPAAASSSAARRGRTLATRRARITELLSSSEPWANQQRARACDCGSPADPCARCIVRLCTMHKYRDMLRALAQNKRTGHDTDDAPAGKWSPSPPLIEHELRSPSAELCAAAESGTE